MSGQYKNLVYGDKNKWPNKKRPGVYSRSPNLIGGFERIRTAVGGFADLCLATRPRNLI